MSITFRANPELPQGEVNVIVEANEANDETIQLMQSIKGLKWHNTSTVAIDTNGGFEMVPTAAIVAVEVNGESLNVQILVNVNSAARSKPAITTLAVHDTLVHFMTRLPPEFIRISRQVIINIRHLRSLKLSYAGNMSASLDGGLEEIVGRRYVPGLREMIGA